MHMFWHPCLYNVCAWLPVCHPQNLSNNDGICEWRMRSQAYISAHIYDLHQYTSFAGFTFFIFLLSS
ncbi:hypothetical protein ES288_A08G011000v1 [Gossypium darwinii]|uniref:Uncharacterized protein n=1 Tax=Gossypium darwinii TaxID=34276 RepID=A0A5D2FGK4_GOSDA|nr:hypothetical protein ES288_A08G011000v1 [Gossypium darwinii]